VSKRANFRRVLVAGRRANGGHRSRDDVIARVLRFVDRHGGRVPNIAALCEAAGVSERTLRSLFTDAFGVGPNRYLRTRRLQVIRATLAVADPRSQTVSGIARRFGFSDAGRMAAEYRALFGEYPSATLARRTAQRTERSAL
jgi:transcriptional regulator GlxA family with amidase domain